MFEKQEPKKLSYEIGVLEMKLENAKNALREIADLAGYDIRYKGNENKYLIEAIAKRALEALK